MTRSEQPMTREVKIHDIPRTTRDTRDQEPVTLPLT